jgi:hypothetical protein
LLKLFESVFYLRDERREIAVAEIVNDNLVPGRALEKPAGAAPGFPFAPLSGAEDHPVKLDVPTTPQELENRSSASDFDVVGVRAKAQDFEPRVALRNKL